MGETVPVAVLAHTGLAVAGESCELTVLTKFMLFLGEAKYYGIYPSPNTILCYALLCFAMLCYALLCFAMLCYAMLCYALLCYALFKLSCAALGQDMLSGL